MVIELLRDAEQQKPAGSKQFDFNIVKNELKGFTTPDEKLLYLAELKTEYLQNKPVYVNISEVPFDQKIELEMNLIKTRKKLVPKKETKHVDKTVHTPRQKARINANVNQFVDVFFQMMNEKRIDGKPFLEADPSTIANVIAENFSDRNGKDIPTETIKTILWPSKFEKRPKANKRFDVFNQGVSNVEE